MSAAASMYSARTTLDGRPTDPRESRAERDIFTPIIPSGLLRRQSRRRRDYTSVMFPISDVIPSKTTPVVTVGLMILNGMMFLYELQLSRPELQLFAQSYGVVPAYF